MNEFNYFKIAKVITRRNARSFLKFDIVFQCVPFSNGLNFIEKLRRDCFACLYNHSCYSDVVPLLFLVTHLSATLRFTMISPLI